MHIPDGLLDPVACIGTGLISAVAVGYAVRRTQRDLPERAAPLLGVMAACIFAAQMLNFPIPGGTSGHILGGVLAGVVLGPWAGLLVMTVVLIVQCVLFQDGGLTALGANVLNVAVIGPVGGYAVYNVLRKWIGGFRGVLAGAVIAAWFSVMAAAALCALEISLGGQFRLGPTLGAMLAVHSVIGIGEALMTGFALAFLLQVRPDLIQGMSPTSGRLERATQLVAAGLLIALVMAALLSPFASSFPDGLEASVASLGFHADAAEPLLPAPMADYQVAALETVGVAGSIAGAIGAVVVFAAAWGLSRRWPRRPAGSHVEVLP
ncbi:energy-coupling factor ABC transporter permease [Lignipirellula cremea]|uniref:Fused nickel transport protein NikMN n=1 Tax=Lignipirellula cremea TaxID=2528010 RepID=A0A518E528_9BACT|nr:energy-coupling factor ABC transporter permease [Lignipirellula cremea]QDU99173.1 Fused nickel transport protein NikMN [Lignipirellula cremea]